LVELGSVSGKAVLPMQGRRFAMLGALTGDIIGRKKVENAGNAEREGE